MNTRRVAEIIVYLRALIIAGMVAELRDDVEHYDRLLAEFDTVADSLPLEVQLRGGLTRRVVEPCRRRVDREGIVAQSDNAEHEHHYYRHPDLGGTWLCRCGSSYLGAAS